ncbi:MAG TPA: aminopeptidase [Isosphaeraceae bacterium]|nr:aminopeptidase [Isosphaeraceae bacterium]
MTDDFITRWADLLVDYCLRVVPGETILVESELPGRSLVEACFRSLVLRGGIPALRLELPGLLEFFLEHATEAQLAQLPASGLFDAAAADGRIRIEAETDARSMRSIDPARQAALDRARAPIRQAARRKRWVLTQYPTEAYAAEAGMALDAYEAFVAKAMFLDRADPAAAWKELGRRQEQLVGFMSKVQTVQVQGPGTDLTVSVDGRTWINSDGKRNMPSGEIFTGPLETSARGRLRSSFPVCRGGREVAGITLEFVNGRVVTASAQEGDDYLRAMLDLDPGARFLGELGLGLNYGINRFTRRILYDEKIGGTAHLALGSSYPETGGTNQSALHWDLIVDLRTEGRILADGRVVMENGQWLVLE